MKSWSWNFCETLWDHLFRIGFSVRARTPEYITYSLYNILQIALPNAMHIIIIIIIIIIYLFI